MIEITVKQEQVYKLFLQHYTQDNFKKLIAKAIKISVSCVYAHLRRLADKNLLVKTKYGYNPTFAIYKVVSVDKAKRPPKYSKKECKNTTVNIEKQEDRKYLKTCSYRIQEPLEFKPIIYEGDRLKIIPWLEYA